MAVNLEKTQKIARKSTLFTGTLTFFLPLFGYLYTGRYRALFRTASLFFGIILLCLMVKPSIEEDEDFMTGMMFLYGAGTAIENSRAVSLAKKRLQEQKIQILKLAKQQESITLADCILETGESVGDVRQLLAELQAEDLVQIDNRDSDGAIVYRII